jgi:hypothetical protein
MESKATNDAFWKTSLTSLLALSPNKKSTETARTTNQDNLQFHKNQKDTHGINSSKYGWSWYFESSRNKEQQQ